MPARCESAHNGIGIEGRGIEEIRIFIAVAPFLIREGVDGEV